MRRLRVVTWNIHGCVGHDGQRNIERIGDAICALAPDIAAFQEVDSRLKMGDQLDIYGYLRDKVGDHGHQAWTLSGADGHYGQLLASRFPLTDRRVHDISVPRREPRKVMEARLRLPFGSLRVIATHLGLRKGERMRQIRRLREIIMTDLSSPLLLLGDLNEWRDRRLGRLFADLFDLRTNERSFPSRVPVFALDRIMCRGGLQLNESWAAREAYLASDHLPIGACVSLPVHAPEHAPRFAT